MTKFMILSLSAIKGAMLLGVLSLIHSGNLLVAANEQDARDLGSNLGGVYVPDCTKPKHKSKPACLCRYMQNWELDICQGTNWWNKTAIVNNIEKVGRIVGGEEAPVDAYPWFARLVFRSGNWAGCGGMLVAKDYVLTAAHCMFSDYTSSAAVQIGAVCPNTSNNCGQPLQQINVVKVIEHPNYNSGTTNNDYALLKLASPANADPVPMDQGSFVPNYPTGKRGLWAIGFGTLSSGGNTASKLRHVELAYVPRTECNDNYGGGITEFMMCAKDPGQDSCQGDSGGPLYDKANNALVGVVSWGYGCALPAYPGVYAQVSARWSWIKSKICEESTTNPGFCSGNPPTAPTPTAPTPTPPTGCSGGQLNVKISIKTDNYPTELSWEVVSSGGSTVPSDPFNTALTTYDTELCLASSLCHTFTIKDTYGDGIRIEDGGDFSVTVDNQEILSLPPDSFTFSMSKQFGQCTAPTPTAPTPTAPTPTAPTPTAPTPTPPVSCPSGQLTVGISVTTDYYADEISWTLSSPSGMVAESPEFNAEKTYEENLCVPSTACYTYTINDSYGDGIPGGGFSLTVNGDTKLTDSGEFTTMTTRFGQCEETSPCAKASKKKFTINLVTDGYGSETSFKVKMRRNNGKFTRQVFSGTNFASSTQYTRSKCLRKNKCYILFVYDSQGDGLCCDYGQGSFQGYWKGVPVPNEDAVFDSGSVSKSQKFGNC